MARATTRRPQMTDEERRAYNAEQLNGLRAVVAGAYTVLHQDPVWSAMLAVAARLPERGPVNVVAITAQLPTATDVRGKTAWRADGRHPARGTKSLRIFAPMAGRRSADEEPTTSEAAEGREATPEPGARAKVRTYKAAPVYDVTQTAGDEYEPSRPRVDIAAAVDRLHRHAAAVGAPATTSATTPDAQARALLAALATLHTPAIEMVPGQRAAEAASAAHIAARMIGVKPGPAPAPQLAGIVSADERAEPAIAEAAARVIETGRQLAAYATGDTTRE